MAEKKEPKVNDLVYIQSRLKAPKSQFNKFGGYAYRNCEDILEAVKPLLKERNCVLMISDEIIQIADRIYVKATSTLITSDGDEYTTSAFAREASSKKGMDDSQVTGSASSYARKYSLNGLFCIDDNKDADTLNVSKEYTQPVTTQQAPAPAAPVITLDVLKSQIAVATKESELLAIYNSTPKELLQEIHPLLTARKNEIKSNKQ